MGNRVRSFGVQTARVARFFAAIVLTVLLAGAQARAGDTATVSSGRSADGSGFLYGIQHPASILGILSDVDLSGEALLRHLSVTGYIQSNDGVYINSKNTVGYHHHINSIESLRQLLQIDVNESIGDNFQAFVRSWFVYEPEYPFEIDTKIGSKSTSDFYNTYGPREYWVKLKTGPLTSFIGNQIVTWGESLAFRVADVVNPQDVSYAFGFNNLEASHQPIQMLHEILNLPPGGPFASNFLELIYAPGLDPLWNHVDYPDDRFENQNAVAGRVDILPDTDNGGRAAGRVQSFGACRVGVSICIGSKFPNRAFFVQPPFTSVGVVTWRVPRATWANSQVGVRFHTLIAGSTEATLFYWRSFDQTPQLKIDLPLNGTGHEVFNNFQGVGATANRPLYELPTWIVNKLPFVLRGEVFYKNHATFNSQNDKRDLTGLENSDQLLTMFALDVDSAPAPWLTESGTLSTNLEWVNTWTLNANSNMTQGQNVLAQVHSNDTNLFFDIATSWWWNAVAPTWAMIYNPDGNTFLLVPDIVLTPPWTNKYFVKIGTVYILGSSVRQFSAGGSIKGLSSIFAQFQYNFKLL